MRVDPRTIDVGAWGVVTVLNHIPGVTTRASCEGVAPEPTPHRHAALAYVSFAYPLPVKLQEFFVAHLDSLAVVETDRIASRWPDHNRDFLDQLLAGAATYAARHTTDHRRCWPLPKLRARLARLLASGQPAIVALCLHCEDLVFAAHPASHEPLPLLHLQANQETAWFAAFVAAPPNRLDPALVAADGWARLWARSRDGDFGTPFHRRWLRFRARQLAHLCTQQMRAGVETARRHGSDVDFFYDDTRVVFSWTRDERKG